MKEPIIPKMLNLAPHVIMLVDYAEYPGPRYEKHGPHSSEEFKRTILYPALREYDLIEINIDGIYAVPYTFLCSTGRTMIEEKVLPYSEHMRRITMTSPDGKNQCFVDNYNEMRNFHKPGI